jgi:hypothetical protein
MPAMRIFLTLTIIVLTGAAANAQSNGQATGWGSKRAGKGQSPSTAIQSVDPISASTVQRSSRDEDDEKERLEGTWRATESFANGAVFRILLTFGAGKNPDNGVVSHSDELFFTAAPSCLRAQGVWKRNGTRRFIETAEGFCFDTNNGFAPSGKIKLRSSIKLNTQGIEFTGNLHIEGFDVADNLVFTDDADLRGVRMRAEAPPK